MHYSMSHLLFWSGLANLVKGQTLLAVAPYQTGPVTVSEAETLSISALGVGADGMTTYVEVGAETLAVEISGTETRTLLSGAIPFTATFVEDASKWMIGTTDSGLWVSCTFGAEGQSGACVDQFVSTLSGGSVSTLTSTYSGLVAPFYTLNAAASAASTPSGGVSVPATPTPTSPGASQPVGSSPTAGAGSSTVAPTPTNAATQLRWAAWMGAIILPVLLHAL
ncbi:hypothetical protein FB451DRAFT_1570930 [Mycena latifolia]|nr:hypothetical protein FB451DRAFT_1570930 [Mycena latifolia]